MTIGPGRLTRWLRRCALGLSCLAFPSGVFAAPPVGEVLPRARIAVTIAGAPDCAPPLRDVLTGQLQDVAARVSWSCQPSFDADEPFRAGSGDDADARVWVDLSAADEARLTLQDAHENRFFLRRLSLGAGLDEIGREEIAGVVRSATMAVLTGGAETVTPAAARVTVSSWPVAAPPSVTVAVTSVASRPPPARVADSPPPPPAAQPTIEIGPAWTVQTLAPEIPLAQEIALAAALSGRRSRLAFWTEAGYRLPASSDSVPAGVRLTALAVRAGLSFWTSPDRRYRVGGGGGVGFKRIWFVPRGDATVDPASPDHFDTLGGRVFVGLRMRATARLVLSVDLLCDVATADVHYDFRAADGTTQRVLTQSPVQPGLSLSAAWRWGA